jgi:hypothetical protein
LLPSLLQYCTLTILDDTQYPVIEGLETFVVFLSSAQGAELTKPSQAVIAINDTFQDGKRLGMPTADSKCIAIFLNLHACYTISHSYFHSWNMHVCIYMYKCMRVLLHNMEETATHVAHTCQMQRDV